VISESQSFGIRGHSEQALDHRIRDIAKSDLLSAKGDPTRICCGCRFSERKIEEPF
jgi:hypothetical protein